MRETATAPASVPSAGAAAGSSSDAPVANAAALAACPDGNAALRG
jgi:hypothetical protein